MRARAGNEPPFVAGHDGCKQCSANVDQGGRSAGLIGYNSALRRPALIGMGRPTHFRSRVASRIPCHFRFPDRHYPKSAKGFSFLQALLMPS